MVIPRGSRPDITLSLGIHICSGGSSPRWWSAIGPRLREADDMVRQPLCRNVLPSEPNQASAEGYGHIVCIQLNSLIATIIVPRPVTLIARMGMTARAKCLIGARCS